jgi:hypothetical protein
VKKVTLQVEAMVIERQGELDQLKAEQDAEVKHKKVIPNDQPLGPQRTRNP